MAKFEEVFEDTQALFNEVISSTMLDQYGVNIKLLANNRSKEIFKVSKANDILTYLSGNDVVIVLNEKIFEQLPDQQKLIIAEEAIAYISYDTEGDKLVITKPDFIAHTGVLAKYTYNIINVARESVKTLYQAEKEAEEASKATTDKANKQHSY